MTGTVLSGREGGADALGSNVAGQLLSCDRGGSRDWVHHAVRLLEEEDVGCAETMLHRLPLPAELGVDLYLKDEAAHPTGSLKHRLARSLVLYGLCNGWIREGTTLVEASSGSTAVSEAWYARLLGLPFVAVLPRATSQEKVDLIRELGGSVRFVEDPSDVYDVAAAIAAQENGHYLDQFTYAERATDWRGNNNVAESLIQGMQSERCPIPAWIVVGAGTGGTAATIGRYLRYKGHDTQLCLVDPEGSAYFGAWSTGDLALRTAGSHIEGIGRPRCELSFLPSVVDRAIRVPDAASLAAMRWLHETVGLYAGPSTGTNLVGALHLAEERPPGTPRVSIVTLLCDGGERYAGNYYDDRWVADNIGDITPWRNWIDGLTS